MRTLTFTLLAVVVLGGCVGPIGNGASSPAAQSSPTAGASTESTASTPAPPANANGRNTVNFSELNAHQRSAFEAALHGEEVAFVPNTSYVNTSAGHWYDQIGPFENNQYVRYRERYYRPEFTDGPLYASYLVRATPGSPAGDDTVVALEDLPASVRDEVRTAIREGQYSAPAGKWDSLPESIRDIDYVRYENRTYGLTSTVGDMWAPVMTVEEVD